MQSEDLHLSDQEMLLTADGELSTRQAAQVHTHLAECWACRARMAEIEGTIVDFARAHRQTLDSQLPPIGGPRALLRAQLAELVSKREAASRRWFLPFTSGMRAAALMGAAVLVAAVVGRILVYHSTLRGANSISPLTGELRIDQRNPLPSCLAGYKSLCQEALVGKLFIPMGRPSRQTRFQRPGFDAHCRSCFPYRRARHH